MMHNDKDIIERITRLEEQSKEDHRKLSYALKRLDLYDKMAVRWNGAAMALLGLGTVLAMTVDNLHAKFARIIEWIYSK